MYEKLNHNFTSDMYIATYDISGQDQTTSREKKTRKTGIVTHTDALIDGFKQLNPDMTITVSQTATPEEGSYILATPEGHNVQLRSIDAKPQELKDPETKLASPERIAFHYETDVHNPNNPVYVSLAQQYTEIMNEANTCDVLLQNPNPLVSILKAEELNYINLQRSEKIRLTTVLHDTGSYPKRFEYISRRLKKTGMDLAFIAISQSVQSYLVDNGIPQDSITLVPNGINVEMFDRRIDRARELGLFACVQARDNLPQGKKLILSSAPRVRLKGHHVIIEAASILKQQGKLEDAYVAFAGKNMSDVRSVGYAEELEAAIREKGLSDDVFLLDSVSPDELAACYGEASISLLASTHPEGLAYTNLEAMLAGAPVITSRLGGPLDYIVHEENGLLVEPNDSIDLASAINRILSSPRLHEIIVQNGRKKAEEYSLERMIKGYAKVITR